MSCEQSEQILQQKTDRILTAFRKEKFEKFLLFLLRSIFLYHGATALVGQGLLIVEDT
jgi:hypothetical protein